MTRFSLLVCFALIVDLICSFGCSRFHIYSYVVFIDEGNVVHGLDELIKYYQSLPPSDDEDSILLKKPLLLGPPPAECRRHGRTNLLHRATREGIHRQIYTLFRSTGISGVIRFILFRGSAPSS